MTDHEPLTKDKVNDWVDDDIPTKDWVEVQDVLSARQGLQEDVQTHRGITKADKVMWDCFVKKWFPLFDEESRSCISSTEAALIDNRSDGGERPAPYIIGLMPIGKDYYEYHTFLVKKWDNPLEFFDQDEDSHSQLSGKTIVPVPVDNGAVGGDRVGGAGELSGTGVQMPPDVKHAPRKGYKYASCTAPMGNLCNKHGVVHRENKDEVEQ